jgi:hypothetical protein
MGRTGFEPSGCMKAKIFKDSTVLNRFVSSNIILPVVSSGCEIWSLSR